MSAIAATPAHANSGIAPTCFQQTGQCIDPSFQFFWDQNGGLAVFGYPLTPAREETNRDTRKRYLTQWFERARFEYHPETPAPYDVLLGRLGADQVAANTGSSAREGEPQPDCLWFPQTGHNVCDQANGVGFKSYWLGHGLLDPKLNAYQRSLALFGFPLTGPQVVANANGDKVLTQWFERARFEYHPGKPQPFKVLLGLMGIERYPDGKFVAPAPCQAPGNVPGNVGVSGTPSFCIGWRDTYRDEQRFLIILKYLNSREEFRYLAPPNSTQLYVPAVDAPGNATVEQCIRRKDFSVRIEAILANASMVVGEMAGEGECGSLTWSSVSWQGLTIPVPPMGRWRVRMDPPPHAQNVPVVASGYLDYAHAPDAVEAPFGPAFTILQFSGSLDDWLRLVRRNASKENPIEERTVRNLSVAGRSAKAYRYTVTGLGDSEQYVLKLSATRLLLIETADAPNPTYRRVVKGLVINQP